jgi:hypothetical protein
MQWDTIAPQWVWFAAAGVLLLLIAAYTTYISYSSKTLKLNSKLLSSVQTLEENGWTPTGRIDFVGSESSGDFFLQVEDTRTVNSVGGVEHREIRWRSPTLDEIKSVVASYHVQRNLSVTPSYVVSSSSVIRSRNSDVGSERADARIAKDEAAAEKPEG